MSKLQHWITQRLAEWGVVPASHVVDRKELKTAILRRRDGTRRENQEWQHADRNVWRKTA